MYAIKQLGSLRHCGRATCFCAQEMRDLLLNMPLTTKEDIHLKIMVNDKKQNYKRCYNSWQEHYKCRTNGKKY